MAESKREIERKYELPKTSGTDGQSGLPDLTTVDGVSSVVSRGVVELDALYYDTGDLRLAADSLTLRRRKGGDDAGWHLKFPVSTGIRDELQAPLSDTLPPDLAELIRSRVRGAEVAPVVRLRSARDVTHLLAADGALLAEVSVDTVRAERLIGKLGPSTSWTEVEVELADQADPVVLDAVEKKLRKAGLRPAASPSKLARALAETAPSGPGRKAAGRRADGRAPGGRENGSLDADEKASRGKATGAKTAGGKAVEGKAAGGKAIGGKAAGAKNARGKQAGRQPAPGTAGDHVLRYLRTQARAIVALDPAVRREMPDAVHQMRVATRRMRSAFRTYRKVLDRSVTDPIADELKWLAGELGADRDQEVLNERLTSRIDALPETLLLGPVRSRLRVWGVTGRIDSHRRTLVALDGDRYLTLLNTMNALLTAPPLRPAARQAPGKVLPLAVLKDYQRLSERVEHALELPPGEERDIALHNARKAAKRVRYAAEAATPAIGKPARTFAKRIKAVQQILGDHQDSVVARAALRDLAIHAHTAGETAFIWGLLYGEEEGRAAIRERELPEVWARASARRLRAALTG